MNDKLQTRGYEKDKKRSKVLGWVFPVLMTGKVLLMHFDQDEVLEVYTPVMWTLTGIVLLYLMYYLYRYRHEDDNKLRLAMGVFGIIGIVMVIVFT